ncbi:uncharacterized protein LOC125229951 [Leguminivora glycinivorella]|uniref:uncharacterized protein LOC125229951 n=1 Tax=Leguminivora glycinivorella TaxID=1035111 RepID=UPI00200F46BC|nr:uncharacterized protein LOC125229044 isoform X2 [Leguminivora glycinivorella]XP_047989775.1 uncharacterized protein LOC125229044 isoform X2 [Leguminivora glycinivorella]XP_047990860.1 uncharacterized protein LOC125229951 [Leguminivora glycinivorella]
MAEASRAVVRGRACKNGRPVEAHMARPQEEGPGRSRSSPVAKATTGNAAVVVEPSALSCQILGLIGRECAVGLAAEGETGVGEQDNEEPMTVPQLPQTSPRATGFATERQTEGASAGALQTTPRVRNRRRRPARALDAATKPTTQYIQGQKQQTLLLEELIEEQKIRNILIRRKAKRNKPTPISNLMF